MADFTPLLNVMKQSAKETERASYPVQVCFGKVISVLPLKIQVDQKITLGKAQLILTRNVTDFETKFTVDAISVYHTSKTTPQVTWTDEQTMKVHNALKNGEEVVLLRQQGGQKYIVIDRVVKA